MKKLTFTIAIPTCYGGKSLESTIRSIRRSREVGAFSIVVRADSKPISDGIKRNLTSFGVKLVENKKPGSQMYKVKQMIEHVHTDIVIITHDDVRFDQGALAAIVKRFNDSPKVTMVGANILAETAQSQFERIIDVGLRGTTTTGIAWRGGDNYLLANGRCLAFRTQHIRKMNIPDNIVNADAYLYFENKRHGGKFVWAREARVFIKNPKHISEHLRQSHRFLYSKEELSQYFDKSIAREYAVPTIIQFEGFLKELMTHPIHVFLYLGILAYAKVTQKRDSDARSPLWKVNVSTKN